MRTHRRLAAMALRALDRRRDEPDTEGLLHIQLDTQRRTIESQKGTIETGDRREAQLRQSRDDARAAHAAEVAAMQGNIDILGTELTKATQSDDVPVWHQIRDALGMNAYRAPEEVVAEASNAIASIQHLEELARAVCIHLVVDPHNTADVIIEAARVLRHDHDAQRGRLAAYEAKVDEQRTIIRGVRKANDEFAEEHTRIASERDEARKAAADYATLLSQFGHPPKGHPEWLVPRGIDTDTSGEHKPAEPDVWFTDPTPHENIGPIEYRDTEGSTHQASWVTAPHGEGYLGGGRLLCPGSLPVDTGKGKRGMESWRPVEMAKREDHRHAVESEVPRG